MKNQLQVPKVGEVVAELIRARIVRGELAIGEQLPPEDELAANFGVARGTMREALRVLEAQGLVVMKRGRGGGAAVSRPQLRHLAREFALSLALDAATVADLDQARLLIEPQAARLLANSHTDEDIEALNAAADRVAGASLADGATRYATAAANFHHVLLERTKNVTLRTIGGLLEELVAMTFARVTTHTDEERQRRTVASYRRLIRLIEAGDADGADEHWQKQIRWTMGSEGRYELAQLFEERGAR